MSKPQTYQTFLQRQNLHTSLVEQSPAFTKVLDKESVPKIRDINTSLYSKKKTSCGNDKPDIVSVTTCNTVQHCKIKLPEDDSAVIHAHVKSEEIRHIANLWRNENSKSLYQLWLIPDSNNVYFQSVFSRLLYRSDISGAMRDPDNCQVRP